MFRNHIRIALRSLWRKKTFAFLNILGLAVGMASALLIFLVIRHETSYDNFHTKLDRIYRVGTGLYYKSGRVDHYGCVSILVPDAFQQDFPGMEKVAPIEQLDATQFAIPQHGAGTERRFKEKDGLFYATPALFDIVDFPWLQGNPASALKEPYTIALSRTIAQKWFGDWQAAVGKTVLMGDKRIPLVVTGILKDPPTNTDLSLRIVLSYATFRSLDAAEFNNQDVWGSFSNLSE